jgi:hypothetical protein
MFKTFASGLKALKLFSSPKAFLTFYGINPIKKLSSFYAKAFYISFVTLMAM